MPSLALLQRHLWVSSRKGNALISGYAQNGQCQQAVDCFEQSGLGIVSWNALIAGYAKDGQGQQALDWSWNALIAGYAQDGQGQQALDCSKHMYALVHMYANLPSVEVFARCKVSLSWNALIAGYAPNRQGQQVLDCFEQNALIIKSGSRRIAV